MHVPVVTNWPALMPSPYMRSSLPSQVSAIRGSPSTLAPVPTAACSPFRNMMARWAERLRERHSTIVAVPSTNQDEQAVSAINWGAPTRAKSL